MSSTWLWWRWLLHHLCEGRRGGGGHLPKNRKVWDCLTPKRGAEYDKHIGAPPPHLKEKLGPITFIYSPHPQHQLRAGATDTNTKKLMTLAALQKSWMHLCTHSPVAGIDFPTVCVCVCPIGGIVLLIACRSQPALLTNTTHWRPFWSHLGCFCTHIALTPFIAS